MMSLSMLEIALNFVATAVWENKNFALQLRAATEALNIIKQTDMNHVGAISLQHKSYDLRTIKEKSSSFS